MGNSNSTAGTGILIPYIGLVSSHDPWCTEVEIPSDGHTGCPWNDDIADYELIWLVEALKHNPHVRKIDFQRARRTPQLFRELADLLRVNKVIECVRFPDGTTDEELLPIARSLLCDNRTVKVLDLQWCNLRGRRGGEIIRALLLTNKAITEMIFSTGLGAEVLGAEGAVCFAPALRNEERCVLKILDLEGCEIGNDGARELSAALGNNNVLEVLDIQRNRITFSGFRHVMEMLETNTCLRLLSVAYNRVNDHDDGARHEESAGDPLSRALQRNTSLEQLSLLRCCLSEADMLRVVQTLATDNQTLSRLSIRHNDEMGETLMTSLGNLLPDVKGLEAIEFSWGYPGISATVLGGFLEGLRGNESLVEIQTVGEDDAWRDGEEEGSLALWRTCSQFVARRNRMMRTPLLQGSGSGGGGGGGSEASGDRRGSVVVVVPWRSLLPHLLSWCNNKSSGGAKKNQEEEESSWAEAKASSLIYHVLCARSTHLLNWAWCNNNDESGSGGKKNREEEEEESKSAEEVETSLIYHVLCAHSTDIFG